MLSRISSLMANLSVIAVLVVGSQNQSFAESLNEETPYERAMREAKESMSAAGNQPTVVEDSGQNSEQSARGPDLQPPVEEEKTREEFIAESRAIHQATLPEPEDVFSKFADPRSVHSDPYGFAVSNGAEGYAGYLILRDWKNRLYSSQTKGVENAKTKALRRPVGDMTNDTQSFTKAVARHMELNRQGKLLEMKNQDPKLTQKARQEVKSKIDANQKSMEAHKGRMANMTLSSKLQVMIELRGRELSLTNEVKELQGLAKKGTLSEKDITRLATKKESLKLLRHKMEGTTNAIHTTKDGRKALKIISKNGNRFYVWNGVPLAFLAIDVGHRTWQYIFQGDSFFTGEYHYSYVAKSIASYPLGPKNQPKAAAEVAGMHNDYLQVEPSTVELPYETPSPAERAPAEYNYGDGADLEVQPGTEALPAITREAGKTDDEW